jgi:hypothetical protein
LGPSGSSGSPSSGSSGSPSSGSHTSSPTTPAVTGVSPASGPTAGGTTVTITGTGLGGATAVSFGGPDGAIKGDSGTSITVTSPPGAAGTVAIRVTTSAGTSVITGADRFTYVAPALPVIAGVSPTSGPAAGGTTVTITGTGLGGATAVSFGGASATITADSGSQITVTSPPGTPGTVNITVTTSAGTSVVTGADQFTYTVPPPAVIAVSPDSGSTAGGTAVTIGGLNLANATGVSFGGASATITADSGSQITVTSPPGAAGTVPITVTTPGGASSPSSDAQFTYILPPSITGISPDSGSTEGGDTITITGTGLANATSVTFGGVAATIQSDSSTEIVVTDPASEDTGTVNVIVTTAIGASPVTAADQFTYYGD